MTEQVLVLGALGNVGTEVVKSLVSKGIRVRAADIFPDKIVERFGTEVEAVLFDFAKAETYAPCFKGIKKMFLMRPPQIADVKRKMYPALEAAKAAGVEHMAFLSIIGIEQNKIVPHYKVEEWLRASGLDYTMLRCSFFMQNLNTTHRAEIKERNEIFIPVSSAKTSFLDVRDIGAIAARCLSEQGHAKKNYDLTGSESLNYFEVADLFTEVLGRPIRYANPSSRAFFLRQLAQKKGLIFSMISTWLYSNTKKGMADILTDEAKNLLGRPTILMKQYIKDYKDSWL